MKNFKTSTLLIAGVVLFCANSIFMRGVTVLKPVKNANGEIVHKPDGRILFEVDTWRNIKINWDAYLLMFLGISLIIFAFGRMIWRKTRK